jgi:spore photoproduct lyase
MAYRINIKRAIVEGNAEDYRLASRVLKNLGRTPTEKSGLQIFNEKPDTLSMDKETLRLLPFRGEFLKPCPGTQGYLCCGYQILNIGTNCPLDCSYCILQAYFNHPSLRVFANIQEELEVIGSLIGERRERIFRIGTGEFTDSLALDPIVQWSAVLPAFVERHKNAVLEFKTKTTRIQGLLSSKNRERIVVSWSLNSPYVASREEHGAPSIRMRVKAAARCQQEGFALAFHFDPLIEHKGWRESYRKTVEFLDRHISPKRIAWISMGCFRFMPLLKPIIRKRHPGSCVLHGEFVAGMDGKMRYFKPVRIEMYRFMRDLLSDWHRDAGLYLCMESEDVWEESMGWSPGDSERLCGFMDQRAIKILGASPLLDSE